MNNRHQMFCNLFKKDKGRGFITEWTVSGDAAARTVTLPLVQNYTDIHGATKANIFDCYIDWGDGSPKSHVTAYNDAARAHTYASNGTYEIEITGKCDGWGSNVYWTAWADRLKCTDVIYWGDASKFGGFKYLTDGFQDCANLKTLGPLSSEILASTTGDRPGIETSGFSNVFYNCSKITQIPPYLLKHHVNIRGDGYAYAFTGTKITTIPVELFSFNTGIFSVDSFHRTFHGCSDLSSVSTIFDSQTLVEEFHGTFENCPKLTTVSENIFQNCVGAKAFQFTFKNCTLLGSISSKLFEKNINVTTFKEVFRGCTSISAVPDYCFYYNTKVTTYESAFSGCTGIISIGEYAFNSAAGSYAFYLLFEGCTGLTTIKQYAFNGGASTWAFYQTFEGCTGLVDGIHATIFENCTGALSFPYVFKDCTGLKTLSSGIFDKNVNAGEYAFYQAFYNCSSLETVPNGLFRLNTAVSTQGFYQTFYGCNKLQVNPWTFYNDGEQSTRFLNRTSDFTGCFQRTSFTGVQGTAPDLWNCDFGTATPTTTDCYAGAGNSGTSLDNYQDIARRLNINVQPATDWAASDTITGQTSGKTVNTVKKLTATTYYVNKPSGDSYDTWTDGEVIGVTGDANKLADQDPGAPTFTNVWGR